MDKEVKFSVIFMTCLIIFATIMLCRMESGTAECSSAVKRDTIVVRDTYSIYSEDIDGHDYLILDGKGSCHIIHSEGCECKRHNRY